MWTFTDNQLEAILDTMKQEFGYVAFHLLYDKSKEWDIEEVKFRKIIALQTVLIGKYEITEMENALKLIELAMQYPVLNQAELPEEIKGILSSEIPQRAKIDSIETVLILL